MTELSPEAQTLVQDGLSVLRPSGDDRARVASRLAERLRDGALITRYAGAVRADAVPWQLLATFVGGLGLLAAASAYHWLSLPPVGTLSAARSFSPRQAAPISVRPAAPNSAVPAAAAPAPSAALPSPVSRASTSDGLGAEVSILSRAASELRAGRPAAALEALEVHQRRFPAGRLVEERRAARVQALCALGNRVEAAGELERLARAFPHSPHVVRARRACGIP